MKAVTDFAATRERIVEAFKVFSEGAAREAAKLTQLQEEWADQKVRKAWFNKSREYWLKYANGAADGSWETRMDSDIAYSDLRRKTSVGWFEDKLGKASDLLRKFDCAVEDCQAYKVILSDEDLTLLSISLQSALEN
jgi:hypothetical protein